MKERVHINVSPDVLVWARESLVLSLNQASEKTDISTKRLIQLETGKQQPSLDELKSFSKTYKRTIATLLLKTPQKEKALPIDRRTIDSVAIGNFHEKTIMAIRKARALAQSFMELKQELSMESQRFNLYASILDNPKEAASKIRRLLNLNELRELTNINHALDGYIEKVESLGVAVFQLSLTQDGLRGFSIVDDIVPIIGIKRGGEQPHSKIFTLFHELGHILLNEGGLCDLSDKTNIEIEKWCNAFSSEVLIPTSELLQMQLVADHQRQNQKIWKKLDLIELANHFHVGPLAMLRSLLENQLTSKSFYMEKHKTWNKPQFGRAKEPKGREMHKESLKERGRTFVTLAFRAFDQNRINMKDLSDFLGLKFSYITKTRELLNS